MNEIIERLKARLNVIKINIAFGDQFEKVYAKDEKLCNQIESSVKMQKIYMYEIEKIINVGFNSDYKAENEEKAKKLLDRDDRWNHTLKLLNEIKNSSIKSCSNVDIKLDDFNKALANMTSMQEQEGINIVVIGNRGVGKSSFINTFFNIDHFDDKAIKTDANECTMIPAPYTAACFASDFELSKSNTTQINEKFVVWDFPGVGTKNFPNSEYREVIKYLPVDSYIYLYERCFGEDDRDLVSLIKEKNVFLVRTKADNELNLEEVRATLESLPGMTDEVVLEQLKIKWEEKKKHCQNDISIKDLLGGEFKNISEKFYYVSCLSREYYDFAQLMKDLLEKLPEEKVEFMLLNLKGTSSAYFIIKNGLMKSQIDIWIRFLIFLFEIDEFEKFLKFFIAKICEIRLVFGLDINQDIITGLMMSIVPQLEIKNIEIHLDNMNNIDFSSIVSKNILIIGQFEKTLFKKISDAALEKHALFSVILKEFFKKLCDQGTQEAINYVLQTH